MLRLFGAALPLLTAASLLAPIGSPPVVVDTLTPAADVNAASWGRHPDSTGAAEVGLVEGPLTPPLGTSQGFVLAEGDVMFPPPTTPEPTPPPDTAADGSELAPTGADPFIGAWGAAILFVGLGTAAAARVRARREGKRTIRDD